MIISPIKKAKSCGNCDHYSPIGFPGPKGTNVLAFGHCRKHAPLLIDKTQFHSDTLKWPNVLVDDWCGDWKRKGK